MLQDIRLSKDGTGKSEFFRKMVGGRHGNIRTLKELTRKVYFRKAGGTGAYFPGACGGTLLYEEVKSLFS
jgi:hypothetical protein